MPAIRNTKNQKSTIDKSLLERIRMNLIPFTELYAKLVEANPCWYKVNNFYFAFYPPELYFWKTKELL